MKYGQPMISRETRLLLVTIAVSMTALWVLARMRFQDRPDVPVTVAPVLAQLRSESTYADLARSVAELRPVITAAVMPSGSGTVLRFRRDAGIVLGSRNAEALVASDRATGLTVVRLTSADTAGVMPWAPRVLDYPRYLLVAEPAGESIALRPVFVGTIEPASSFVWGGEVWALPSGTPVEPGSFVFTIEGALAGLSITERGRPALLPAAPLMKLANQMIANPPAPAGTIGVSVQSLSPLVADITGAQSGVVVTAVAAGAPAADLLVPTDVIEAVNGAAIGSIDQWRVRMARVSAGETLTLRVRGEGNVRDVQVSAAPAAPRPAEPEEPRLGLQLTNVRGAGARVTSVLPNSRADRAALQTGDVITAIGRTQAPTSAQVNQAFASLRPGASVLVVYMRDTEHRITSLEKTAPAGEK